MLCKKFLLFFLLSFSMLILFAQKKNKEYLREWKKIDSLIEKEGLPQSALKDVNAIYNMAKKENNEVQLVKALLYRMTLNDQLSEQGKYENITLLEKEILLAKEPFRSILHSIAGGSYWHYLQLNRWQFYDRTTTTGYKKDDIATWDLKDLYKKISEHYLLSLTNKELLTRTTLQKLDPIIIKGNSRQLRPSLFDLLCHRALVFFSNDERYITRPAYAFEISDSMAFADAADFAKYQFTTSDTLSFHYKALQLYQELLSFHLADIKKDALIDADILRLQFVNNFSTHPDKNDLYKIALERLVQKFPDEPGIGDAMYLLAEWHMSKGRTYDPNNDTTGRFEILKAKEWCEKSIATKPATEGKSNAINLIKEIVRKEIQLETEKVNTPGAPFRVLVSYRNFTNGHFRLIKVDRQIKQALSRESWNDSLWNELVAIPAIKQFDYPLPDTKDHQQHRVEIKVDGLSTGEYALLGSTEKGFSLKSASLAIAFFNVSDIAFVHDRNKYYVLNRTSGTPLASATVQLWREEYNYQKKEYELRKLEKFTTAKSGYFELKENEKNGNYQYRLEISYGKDRLFTDNYIDRYVYYQQSGQDKREQTFLFTDRSLYRPGQTVYFKGIVIESNQKKHTNDIISGRKSTVELADANNERVDSLVLTTNDYGSYSGKFTLPTNLLNGQFIIKDNSTKSQVRIQVEEYKRPKFFVEIEKPGGTYRLQDSIHVESAAKSYAGNNINGALVTYRVVRRAIFPMWVRGGYGSRIWPPYPRQEMEVAHGSGTTGADGKFKISFVAYPDKNIPKESHPVFYYEVTADVTDINGETHTGATSVSVAYEALKMEVGIPALTHTDSLHEINISTTNMNDSFQAANVNLAVYKLSAPVKIFRERYWEQPDQFIMNREEYYRNFPHDLYADETDMTWWKKERPVIEIAVITKKDSAIKLPGKGLAPGWYLFEANTKDKYGETVTDKKYVQVFRNKPVSPTATAMITGNKISAEPGDKVNYDLISNMDSLHVIHELIRNAATLKELPVKNNITITEADRGTILVKMVFVKNNRVYSYNHAIEVPWLNKRLKIDYMSFRDKTLPGTKETWKVRISGNKGEKLAAELLTAMYDASLDQFHPHTWIAPNLWWSATDYSKWQGNENFTSVASLQKNITDSQDEVFMKMYDKLKTEDEGVTGRSGRGRLYKGAVDYDVVNASIAPGGREMQLEKMAAPSIAQDEETKEYAGENKKETPAIQPRKNLDETAFFFPALHTDSSGNIEFSFTTPEALTTWKWMLVAHTKELAVGAGEQTMITQKQLMVQPNVPRFLREGDRLDFSSKVVNMTGKELTRQAKLTLTDPVTGETIDGIFHNISPTQFFTVGPGEGVPVTFSITIPFNYHKPVSWKVTAFTNNQGATLTDGEQSLLPVITNRMLVTETLPLPIRGSGSKKFSLDKLLKSSTSRTLLQHGITVEFTSNPAWYAVQALPYLTEEKSENANEVFNRYYANALASHLANSSPRLKAVIEKWKTSDTSAFLSNLQKNEELKSILLQETPWVLEAKTEAQQKQNIALLFDMVHMSSALNNSLSKLKEMQSPNGGFVWFKGGPDDRYMTQYIISGIGHLKQLHALPETSSASINEMINKGVSYLDQELKKDYLKVKDRKKVPAETIDVIPVQYLYMRSFFVDIAVPGDVFAAYNYYRNHSKQGWLKLNPMLRGMIALSLFRTGDVQTARKITAALKESSLNNEEMGRYWKAMSGGYYWHESPVEAQSILIEAFSEITKDAVTIAEMKTWLLKNKQTNSWKTSRATADACYALLLQGSNWMDDQPEVEILLGEEAVTTGKTEAGTGYFKTRIPAEDVQSSMGNITVNMKTENNTAKARPAWGAVYWQYFEDLDKVTPAAGPFSISKKLFVQKNTDRGAVLFPLDNNNTLHVGDKVKVRIEIRADRTLEYVHMKDMRASAMEPVNVISGYKWQGGLGYYESTRDASTNFYFSILPKGVYVFEYDLFVTHTGSFSNGVTSIQCLYAPEFSSHSEGIKVNADNPQ